MEIDDLSKFNIVRKHNLGLIRMRAIAFGWAEIAEAEQQMSCIYEEGEFRDVLLFTKPSVKGRLSIDQNLLEVQVELGILMTPFKNLIELEISKNLDKLLDLEI